MIKIVEVENKKYKVNTTGHGAFGYKRVTIDRLIPRVATGVLANTLLELGHPINYEESISIDKDEEEAIVIALGYKFSRSAAWHDLWEYYRNVERVIADD